MCSSDLTCVIISALQRAHYDIMNKALLLQIRPMKSFKIPVLYMVMRYLADQLPSDPSICSHICFTIQSDPVQFHSSTASINLIHPATHKNSRNNSHEKKKRKKEKKRQAMMNTKKTTISPTSHTPSDGRVGQRHEQDLKKPLSEKEIPIRSPFSP